MEYPLDGYRAYLTSISVAVVQACTMGTFAGFSVFVTEIRNDAALGHPSLTTLGGAQGTAQAVMVLSSLAAGIACDRFGLRPVLCVASVFFLLMPILLPFVKNMLLFVVVFAVTLGVSLGSVSAPCPVAIGSWFSPSRVSLGMGIGEAGVAVGSAIHPIVAGLLLSHFDHEWRSAMKLMGLFGIPPLLLSLVITQRPHMAVDAADSNDPCGESVRNHRGTVDCHIDNTRSISSPVPSLWNTLITVKFGVLFTSQVLFGFSYFGWMFLSVPYARIMGSSGTVYNEAPTITVERASALLTFFGVASACAALVLGFIGYRSRVQLVLCASLLSAAVAVGLCALARVYWNFVVLYSVVGVSYAGGLTCLPTMISVQFAGPRINTVMGVAFAGF